MTQPAQPKLAALLGGHRHVHLFGRYVQKKIHKAGKVQASSDNVQKHPSTALVKCPRDKAFFKAFPNAEYTVVTDGGASVDIMHFTSCCSVIRETARLRWSAASPQDFITTTKQKYDVIVLYQETDPCWSLSTDFLSTVQEKLTKHGVHVQCLFGSIDFGHQSLLKHHFDRVNVQKQQQQQQQQQGLDYYACFCSNAI